MTTNGRYAKTVAMGASCVAMWVRSAVPDLAERRFQQTQSIGASGPNRYLDVGCVLTLSTTKKG